MESLDEILRKFDRHPTEGLTKNTSETVEETAIIDCDICDNRRWLSIGGDLGTPEFGGVRPCECQETVWGASTGSALRRYSQLGPLERLTFATLDERGRPEVAESSSFRAAADAARRFADNPQGWLVLIGPSGSGKTHLVASIANKMVADERPVLYVSTPELLDHLRSAFDSESEISQDGLLGQITRAPVLILDDFGAGGATPWAIEKLDRILTSRFNSRVPTVVATSANPAHFDERIKARLFDMVLCDIRTIEPGRLDPSAESTGVPTSMLRGMTFEGFTTRRSGVSPAERHSLQQAKSACSGFAEDPSGWILLMGPTGTGKSHLAVSIANERLKMGEEVRFWFVPDLLDHLRKAFNSSSGAAYDEVFEQVKTVDLLILDDMGGENPSPWVEEKLYQLVVHRHNHHLPTVITTRLYFGDEGQDADNGRGRSPRGRTTFSDAIGSRLKDQRVVTILPITAPDYRE